MMLTPQRTPQELAKIEEFKAQLDPEKRNSVIEYGAAAQAKLDEVANAMMEGVKNKDIEAAGESLGKMVLAIRGFDVEALKEKELPWWKRLLGFTSPVVEAIQKYEEIKEQIELIANDLERHKARLMEDVVALERLYEANLAYFKELELYIKAGEERLEELRSTELPKLRQEAESGDMLAVQKAKELQEYIDDLERRVHDLKLSRQVAMQALPSIRLVQENDKALINKITSTLVNTIPLWRNQLAQVITVQHSRQAARAIKASSDLTNELLEKNAEALREANKEIKKEVERGVFDIESVKKANETLIATLNESLALAEEGKRERKKAAEELMKLENALKEALLAIKAKRSAQGAVDEKYPQSAGDERNEKEEEAKGDA